MILIDTHVILWMADNLPELGVNAAARIDEETFADGVGVSPISFWEIAMLADKGKLKLARATSSWVMEFLDREGLQVVPFGPEIAMDAGHLPGDIHGDPADRFLIATARHAGVPLLTGDRKILEYAESGHVRTINARY